MKVRIIANYGMFKAQYKALLVWEDIWYQDRRRFKTELDAWEAINAKMYPEGRVICEDEV